MIFQLPYFLYFSTLIFTSFIIIKLENMNNKIFKLNCITEHNIYHQTDKLYDPLRNALAKTKNNFLQTCMNSLIDNSNEYSSLSSHSRHILNPKQADTLTKTIYIPTQIELVPTHDIDRVTGKTFYVMDVQVKKGNPLTGSQVNRICKGNIKQKIVYQYKENSNSRTNHLMLESICQRQNNRLSASVHRQTYRTGQPTRSDSVHNFPRQTAQLYRTPSNLRISSRIKANEIRSTIDRSKSQSLQLNNGVKSYKFKADMLQESKRKSYLKIKKNTDYKYNLFSVIDEIGNKGFKADGCLPSNQVCAPRRQNSKWS